MLNQYEDSQMPQLLAALVDYEAAAELDSKAGLIFSSTQNLTTVGLLYAAPLFRPEVFESFYPIPVYQAVVPPTIGTEADLSAAFASPTIVPTK